MSASFLAYVTKVYGESFDQATDGLTRAAFVWERKADGALGNCLGRGHTNPENPIHWNYKLLRVVERNTIADPEIPGKHMDLALVEKFPK